MAAAAPPPSTPHGHSQTTFKYGHVNMAAVPLPASAFQALGVRPGLRGLPEEEGGASFLKQPHAPQNRVVAARCSIASDPSAPISKLFVMTTLPD